MSSLIKILFELPEDWHGSSSETLWAASLNNGLYQIQNVPFLVKDVSLKDVVSARNDDLLSSVILAFEEKVKSGGHSTYRIALTPEQRASDAWRRYWEELAQLGCSHESGEFGHLLILAVDVPPQTNIFQAYAALEKGTEQGAWDFEEGNLGHPV